MRWFPLALLLSASIAGAQAPVRAVPAPPPSGTPYTTTGADGEKKARLEGIVLSLNGEAVRKATIRLQGSVVQPGRYYLSASDRRGALIVTPDRPGRPNTSQEGNITTFYPNGTDAASGVPVDVAAGGEMRGVDIRLRKAKVYTVRGKAVDASG